MAKHEHKKESPGQIVIDTEVLTDESPDVGGEIGTVQIHNSVIAGIARIAALNVSGVYDLSAGMAEGFATVLGTKKATERGVKVLLDGDFATIEVYAVMDYGVRIPQVAWQIQSEVRRAVEQMTGKTVSDVKVIVQGVKMPAKKPASPEERKT